MTSQRLKDAFTAIDNINNDDPNKIIVDNNSIAKELIYGQRMTACLNEHWPQASEYLQVAVRAQHIKRWYLKRADFPTGKAGYLKWRKELGLFHAQLAKEIMLESGYNEQEAEQTANIVSKKQLKSNSDSQTLEDVACLVFLIHYFDDFAAKHEDDKVIDIVQKTWRKMSSDGHNIALSLSLPEHLARLVSQALSA